MKRTQLTQIKTLNIEELKQKAKTLRQEIANLVMDKNMKKIKDLKSVAKLRKDLAQALTIIRQKEIIIKLESESHKESKEPK